MKLRLNEFMQLKHIQRLLLLGKIILFLITYVVLVFAVTTICQNIFPGRRFYEQLPVELFLYAVDIFVLVLFIKVIDKEKIVSAVGLSLKNHVKEFFIGGLAGAVSILIGFLIIIKLNFEQVGLSSYWIVKFDYFFIGTLLLLCSAIIEEMFFRGYVFRKLSEKFPPFISLILSAVFFVSLHLFNYDMTFWSIVNIFLGGIVLGMLYLKTKNLWLAVGFHFSWNYIQSLLGFNVSGGGRLPSILSLDFEEMNAWNGGDFGFEGSYVSSIILICIVIVITRIYWKKIKQNQNDFATN